MKNNSFLKIALSVNSNPGIYALLLGSGLSRSAGILTGWEIVLDLIRKLAALHQEKPEPDPETWYVQKFGEPPDYSKLLDRLTSTSAERMTLLKSYFEPNEEEKEQGLKLPTPAHRAIAKLVKLGCFRMILTTNFDRLIEKALRDEGIEPDVISNEDDLKGALPYIHSKCYVVKLHGDYLDTRIKNTKSELSNYSSELNAFLDRVFDDFGLIICGWSGTWDIALRKAILRSPNRRFSTFWLAKDSPSEEAKKIIQHKKAEVIHIESADWFFTDLLQRIESLKEIEKPHPISVAVAVEMVKKYLSEDKHFIRLRDLLHQETEKLYKEIFSSKFPVKISVLNKEMYKKRIKQYEALSEILLNMFSTISYYGSRKHARLLTQTLNRISSLPLERNDGLVPLINLQYYPALLLLYIGGISALASENYHCLKAILIDSSYRDITSNERKTLISKVYTWSVFDSASNTHKWLPIENAESRYTPISDYLNQFLFQYLSVYLPDNRDFDEIFDLFEYILNVVYMDLVDEYWSPYGSYAWRYRKYRKKAPIDRFIEEVIQQGAEAEILKVGFFESSVERFKKVVEDQKSFLKKIRKNFW
jgi:hypothetical protein